MAFSSILTFFTEKWGVPRNFIAPGDSSWKTASSNVKISRKNHSWLIQFFQTKFKPTCFLCRLWYIFSPFSLKNGGSPEVLLHQEIAREKLRLLMWKYLGETMVGLLKFFKQSSCLYAFMPIITYILTFLDQKLEPSRDFIISKDSPWKTASSDVKISMRNDGWLVQFFQTKITITCFFHRFLTFINFHSHFSQNMGI